MEMNGDLAVVATNVAEVEEEEEEEANFVVFNVYRNIIHVGCLGSNQMVVVENPFARQLEQMPVIHLTASGMVHKGVLPPAAHQFYVICDVENVFWCDI